MKKYKILVGDDSSRTLNANFVRISNLADGIHDHDATTLSQLKEYTEDFFTNTHNANAQKKRTVNIDTVEDDHNSIKNLKQNVNELNNDNIKNKNDIIEIKDNVKKIDIKIKKYHTISQDDLQPLNINHDDDDIIKLKNDIDNINDNINKNNNNISNINGDVTNLKSDLINIKDNVNKNKNDISHINGDVTNLKSDIDRVNTNINNINGNISESKNALTNNNNKIETLDNDIKNINTKIITTVSDFKNMEIGFTKVNNDISKIQESTQIISDIPDIKLNLSSLMRHVYDKLNGIVYNNENKIKDLDDNNLKIKIKDVLINNKETILSPTNNELLKEIKDNVLKQLDNEINNFKTNLEININDGRTNINNFFENSDSHSKNLIVQDLINIIKDSKSSIITDIMKRVENELNPTINSVTQDINADVKNNINTLVYSKINDIIKNKSDEIMKDVILKIKESVDVLINKDKEIDNKIDNIIKDTNELKNKSNNNEVNIISLTTSKNIINNQISELLSFQTDNTRKVSELLNYKSSSIENIGKLSNDNTKINNSIEELKTFKTNTETEIKDIKSLNTELKTFKINTETEIKDIKSLNTELKTFKSNSEIDIGNLNTFKDNTKYDISIIRTNVTSHAEKINNLVENVNTLKNEDVNIKNSINILEQFKSENDNKIKNLDDKFTSENIFKELNTNNDFISIKNSIKSETEINNIISKELTPIKNSIKSETEINNIISKELVPVKSDLSGFKNNYIQDIINIINDDDKDLTKNIKKIIIDELNKNPSNKDINFNELLNNDDNINILKNLIFNEFKEGSKDNGNMKPIFNELLSKYFNTVTFTEDQKKQICNPVDILNYKINTISVLDRLSYIISYKIHKYVFTYLCKFGIFPTIPEYIYTINDGYIIGFQYNDSDVVCYIPKNINKDEIIISFINFEIPKDIIKTKIIQYKLQREDTTYDTINSDDSNVNSLITTVVPMQNTNVKPIPPKRVARSINLKPNNLESTSENPEKHTTNLPENTPKTSHAIINNDYINFSNPQINLPPNYNFMNYIIPNILNSNFDNTKDYTNNTYGDILKQLYKFTNKDELKNIILDLSITENDKNINDNNKLGSNIFITKDKIISILNTLNDNDYSNILLKIIEIINVDNSQANKNIWNILYNLLTKNIYDIRRILDINIKTYVKSYFKFLELDPTKNIYKIDFKKVFDDLILLESNIPRSQSNNIRLDSFFFSISIDNEKIKFNTDDKYTLIINDIVKDIVINEDNILIPCKNDIKNININITLDSNKDINSMVIKLPSNILQKSNKVFIIEEFCCYYNIIN